MYKRISESRKLKYILFTFFFWFTAFYLMNRSFQNGKFGAGGSDAFVQMYPAMLYISRMIKQFFEALITGQQYHFPMLEWSLGMGENTISALNYYGFGDPFYLLSAFFNEEQMPYFFTVFFYARMYLGGIACMMLLEEVDYSRSHFSYVIAGLVYVFSGFGIQSNIFIIFVHALMYTPMMVIGAERILKDKKKGILALAVFLYALSGFFFLYVSSIALAVYVIIRIIVTRYNLKEAGKKIFVMILEYLLGIGLACVIFIPSVVGFLSSNRSNIYRLSWKPIPLDQLKELLSNLFFPQYENAQAMSVAGIAIVSMLLIVVNKKRNKEKFGVLLVAFCLLIPAITTIMSGFGGYYDRWEITLVLYASYLTFVMWDDMKTLSMVQRIVLSGSYIVLGVYAKREGMIDNHIFHYTLVCLGIIVIFLVVVYPLMHKWNKITFAQTVFGFVIAFTVCRGWTMVARDQDISLVRQENVVAELLPDEQDSFYRIDYEKVFGEPRLGMNISLVLDYPGISEYFSIENKYYVEAFSDWENGKVTHNNEGMDQRAILETLASVKYYIGRTENEGIVPYGFTKIKTSKDGEWNLYENQYALPVVYSYSKTYPAEEYHAMNGLQKQQAILQAAVLESSEENNAQTNMPEALEYIDNQLEQIDYKILSIENGQNENGHLYMKQGAVMTVEVPLQNDHENCLYVVGNPQITVDLGNGYEKYKEPITLGYSTQSGNRILKIMFRQETDIMLEDIQIWSYDFSNYRKYVDELNDGTVSNINVTQNEITCETNSTENKILCLAVPYEKGWTAYIDGKECTVYRMNSMYNGIVLPKGTHQIMFRYRTPGLKLGICISTACFLGIIIVFFFQKKKNSRKGLL